MRVIWKLFLATIKTFYRDRMTFFFTLIFPFMFVIIFGFVFGIGSVGGDNKLLGYRARIRNHGHSCFLCEIVIRSQFHTTYEPEA
jgi:hypothetical protein